MLLVELSKARDKRELSVEVIGVANTGNDKQTGTGWRGRNVTVIEHR